MDSKEAIHHIDNMPLLSICIPNYNRVKFLSKLLIQICTQIEKLPIPSDVDVVISDNCSTEDIQSIIQKMKQRYRKAKISFAIQPENRGFDVNVLSVVEMAKGEYCWLLSNDDSLYTHSVLDIVSILKKEKSIDTLLLNYAVKDFRRNKIVSPSFNKRTTIIDTSDFVEYFFWYNPFSYYPVFGMNHFTLSANIVRRSCWNNHAKKAEPYIGRNCIHLIIILLMQSSQKARMYYEPRPMLVYLINNERSWGKSLWESLLETLPAFLSQRTAIPSTALLLVKGDLVLRVMQAKIQSSIPYRTALDFYHLILGEKS